MLSGIFLICQVLPVNLFLQFLGVLDPDELTFINKGLQAVEDIRKRKAETKSTINGKCVSLALDILIQPTGKLTVVGSHGQ